MASVVCEVIKHMMYKIDIANIYLGILLHYLLVLAAVLIFGYAFNWVNQLLLNWNPSFQFASLSSDLANRLHK